MLNNRLKERGIWISNTSKYKNGLNAILLACEGSRQKQMSLMHLRNHSIMICSIDVWIGSWAIISLPMLPTLGQIYDSSPQCCVTVVIENMGLNFFILLPYILSFADISETAREARKSRKIVFTSKSPFTDGLSMLPSHTFHAFHVLSNMGGSELHGKGYRCQDRPLLHCNFIYVVTM